ncbi:MAG: ATP-binding protein [Pseudomonadales bacterium]
MVARAQTYAASSMERALALRGLAERDAAGALALSAEDWRVRLDSGPPSTAELAWWHEQEVREAVGQLLERRQPSGWQRFVYGFQYLDGQSRFLVSLPMPDSRWLSVDASTDVTSLSLGGFWPTLFLVGTLVLMLTAAKHLTRYVARFSVAAESIGRTGQLVALPENQGPREVRRASRAFNAMQRRVQALIDERTQMLGAMSHDLRTIATRLQLRVEKLPDAEARERAERDLTAMTSILQEALAFAREDSSTEPMQRLDLASLLQAVVDDAMDTGGKALLVVEGQWRVTGQSVALRRAFSNLVENAVLYGGSAIVTLRSNGSVTVLDPGAGIAEADRARALQAFVRLESSRNRETGGTGLGLTIARTIFDRHGATMEFAHTDRGFEVAVDFKPPRVAG